MDEKILKFFKKHKIHINDIKYLLRQENKTCIYMKDGRIVRTFITVKDLYDVLIPYDYLSINKGTVVARNQIDHIENCTYYMRDGLRLEGRKRGAATHKLLNKSLHQDLSKIASTNIRTRFSVLDNMPLAFCVIELIFNQGGTGIDFVFRYCNKELLRLEKLTANDIVDQSFYQVFPDGDRKLLATYTDVAVNGGKCHMHTYSSHIGKNILIKAFQPLENFCACVLIPESEMAE
ncbi:LytTR family transcriptional regulator DNA-binding domain-containing protein [Blautia sp. HCP3S3_H10_1]|uniref:LytTR family transcriptional regulator DNA-binding domain-containing protein n=1 Tax=unclassified Blautia TaxID=2648079 RepID=UPI003F8DE2A9|nr:LytTR family transcriptional regulator DNA-binding domain-containing protein [Clostridia bacterium]